MCRHIRRQPPQSFQFLPEAVLHTTSPSLHDNLGSPLTCASQNGQSHCHGWLTDVTCSSIPFPRSPSNQTSHSRTAPTLSRDFTCPDQNSNLTSFSYYLVSVPILEARQREIWYFFCRGLVSCPGTTDSLVSERCGYTAGAA